MRVKRIRTIVPLPGLRKTEPVSPLAVRQVPVQPGNPSGKMIAEQVGKIPGEQERKQYALAVQELAALGEDQYQLKIWEDETIDPDKNRYCSARMAFLCRDCRKQRSTASAVRRLQRSFIEK